MPSLVGSEMCIRDRGKGGFVGTEQKGKRPVIRRDPTTKDLIGYYKTERE